MKTLKILTLAALLCGTLTGRAAVADATAIEFTTDVYNIVGESNYFYVYLSATETTEFSVDCGTGEPIVYQVRPTTDGTAIPCIVNEAGRVVIKGDGSKIDYCSISGAYVTNITFSHPESLDILALPHNSLRSLDLTEFVNLRSLDVSDNPFNEKALVVGPKPGLMLLDIAMIDNLDPSFDLTMYPKLISLDAISTYSLSKVDPTKCPDLARLSIDATSVSELDVTKNPKLLILNISDTRIQSIDVTQCPLLTELYVTHESGTVNPGIKMSSLDVTKNPELQVLFAAGNALTSIDVSNNPKLHHLWLYNNRLTELDLSNNTALLSVKIQKNYFDFKTLPLNPGTWNEYEYQPYPFTLPQTCKVDSPIDLSARVLRPNSQTYATVYTIYEGDPLTPVEVDADDYSFVDGVVRFNRAPSDSVYVLYTNSLFPDYGHLTNKFKVKSEADFGQPDVAATYLPAKSGTAYNLTIGVHGASEANPVNVVLDLGGDYTTTVAVTSDNPTEPNATVTYREMTTRKITVPEGAQLSTLRMDGVPLTSIDLSKQRSLRDLSLAGCGLYGIDLQWNRSLQSVDLSGNNLTNLTLNGNNASYHKTALKSVNVADNELSTFELLLVGGVEKLNIANNKLTTFDFEQATSLSDLNISGNAFELLKLSDCENLKRLDASHNQLTQVIFPDASALEMCDLSYNLFTFANLPQISCADYRYAPQESIQIPTRGPGVNLTGQYIEVDGGATQYTWQTVGGTTLTPGVDYTEAQGRTRFINTSVGKVYCRLTHPAFPGFSGENALRTTEIEPAPMPTNVIAQFTTVNDNDAVGLSLAAAADGTALYIDWTGQDDLEQYPLQSSYTLFNATTVKDATVKVYTYDAADKITVFSMSGAKIKDADFSGMTSATTLTLSETGLSTLKFPATTGLRELNLSGNAFTTFDKSRFPELVSLVLSDNPLTTVDISGLNKLQTFSASKCGLTSVTLSNPNLWGLELSSNNLATVNLEGVPAVEQINLSGNLLSEINIDGLEKLHVLFLDQNRFTFHTLPLPRSNFLYTYANQAAYMPRMDGTKVDLSDLLDVNGVQSEYRWYLDMPMFDSNGDLTGEELFVDDEYSIKDGVTTFHSNFNNVMCVITNSLFPSLYMYTPLLSVEAGIDNVIADNAFAVRADGRSISVLAAPATEVRLYSVNGMQVDAARTDASGHAVIDAPAAGIYVVATATHTAKVVTR